MILKTDQEVEVLEFGKLTSKKVTLSIEDQEKLLYMLSQGNYSLPIESSIREVVSNAWDAQIEIDKDPIDYPITVGLDQQKFWVKDHGRGIDPERMEIISRFGASTKGTDTRQLGTFGIGFFAPHSYTSQFTCESNYEGIKRKWLVSKDGIDQNITPLSEEETDEENGTTIIIPIKNIYNEYGKWKDAIVSTLPYFKGVVIQGDTFDSFNNSKIYEGKSFIYRSGYSPTDFHIVLDQVVYTIPLSDIGLPNQDFQVGVKLSLRDGIIPTPSREGVILTDKTKELIKERFKEVLEELTLLSNNEKDINLWRHFSKNKSNYNFKLAEEYLNIDKSIFKRFCSVFNVDLPNTAYIPLKPDFSLIPDFENREKNLRAFFLASFREVGRIEYSKYTTKWANADTQLRDVILVDTKFDNSKIEFFKTVLHNKVFVKFERKHKLWRHYHQYSGLYLRDVPRDKWRDVIQAWQAEEDLVVNSLSKVSDYQKDYDEWLANKPKKAKAARQSKEKEEITIRFPVQLEKGGSAFNCKFEPEILSVEQLHSCKKTGDKLYVYSDKREEVDKLWFLHLVRPKVMPVLLNKTEIHKIEHLNNFMKYEDFAKGKSRLAHKYITALMIYKEIMKEEYLEQLLTDSGYYRSKYKVTEVKSFSKTKGELKVKHIIEYLSKWKPNKQNDLLFDSLIDTYEKAGMIDLPIWKEWLSLKEDLKLLWFVPYVDQNKFSGKGKKMIEKFYIMQRKNQFLERKLKNINND